MAISDDQAMLIRDRAKGWEQVFEEFLLNDLMPVLKKRVAGYTWPCHQDRENFVQDMVTTWTEQARKGRLLTFYDPSQGGAAAFLTGSALKFRIWERLAALRAGPVLFGSLEHLGGSLSAPRGGQQPDGTKANGFRLPEPDLASLRHSATLATYACLQLFPFIEPAGKNNWAMEQLLTRVSSSGQSDPRKHVERLHREFDNSHGDRLAELHERWIASRAGSKRSGDIERRIATLVFERLFCPLDNSTVTMVLSIDSRYAPTLKYRYRAALPDLYSGLPRLAAVIKRLGSHPSGSSDIRKDVRP